MLFSLDLGLDPVQVNISVSNNNFPVGGSISLPCDVRGYPPPQVQWYKDGVPLETSQRIHISGNALFAGLRVFF